MPRATKENVLSELIDTFGLKESRAKGIVQNNQELLTIEDGTECDPLEHYLVAQRMLQLVYGDEQIPHNHLQE